MWIQLNVTFRQIFWFHFQILAIGTAVAKCLLSLLSYSVLNNDFVIWRIELCDLLDYLYCITLGKQTWPPNEMK